MIHCRPNIPFLLPLLCESFKHQNVICHDLIFEIFFGNNLFFFSFVNTLPSLKFKKVQNKTKMWLKVKCSVMFFLISWGEIFSFLASCAPYFFCHESWKIHIQFENFLLVTNSYENSFAKQHQFDLTPTFCLSCSFFVPSV